MSVTRQFDVCLTCDLKMNISYGMNHTVKCFIYVLHGVPGE